MKSGYFITGIDTNIGKTWVTIALLRYFALRGLTVVGMKPVSAGCVWQSGQWLNADALLMQSQSNINLSYQQINPYAFEQPVSPHIAAAGTKVKMDVILKAFTELKQKADVVVVEGAGGWLSPLGQTFDNAQLVEQMQLPIIMVVAIRLGCINHARLTINAIRQAKAVCAGWVAVEIEPDRLDFQATIDYLQMSLDLPLLAVLPYLDQPDFDLLAKKFGNLISEKLDVDQY